MRSTIIGILAAVVTVAIGVTLVKAQLIFADGSVQTTAAVSGDVSVESGSNFMSVGSTSVFTGTQLIRTATPVVASGKELVVLQVKFYMQDPPFGTNTLAPVQIGTWNGVSTNPDYVSFLIPPHSILTGVNGTFSSQNSVDNTYPNGVFVVGPGDRLVIQETTGVISVMGYFRDIP